MALRIAKFLSESGVASRRSAEKMILDGRVYINGNKIESPATFVSESDVVSVDGKQVKKSSDIELYAFHKPVNTMTTRSDPNGRKTIYDVLPQKYNGLKYVGRLDFKTTGLLLMTNSGDLARKLTLPSSNIPRTYIATTNGNMKNLALARKGVTVDGIKYRPMQISVLNDKQILVTTTEGKKNEIRIVLRFCGAPVSQLHRVSFGNIELGNLPVGKIVKVPKKTIDEILKNF
ncbi:MAG: rRNA pseudouridine synthase [Proteobacteria bacterium]|nr:rRNA pseudouridine synthase [Candidatus Enterousia scatequi]